MVWIQTVGVHVGIYLEEAIPMTLTKLLQNCSFSQHMDKQEFFVQEFISSLSESLSIFKLLSPDLNFEVLIQLGLKCNGKTWKVFPSFCF